LEYININHKLIPAGKSATGRVERSHRQWGKYSKTSFAASDKTSRAIKLDIHNSLIKKTDTPDKLVMKFGSILIIFTLFLLSLSESSRASEKDCSGMNHPAYQDEYRACLRKNIAISASEAGVDCIDCLFEQNNGPATNQWVEALGVLAQPLAYLAGTYTVAKYQNQTQEAWAKAYSSGFTECTNRFNSYLNYNTSVGANPIGSTDAMAMSASCNGQGYGSYAGYGGLTGNSYGGYGNPFLSNGFSSGFMNGMGGINPYGNSSIYNNGMTSGGIGIGAWGSISTTGSGVYNTGVTQAFGF